MQERIKRITTLLDDKKAEDIEVIDMQEQDYIAKFVVIATTLHSRHAFSLSDDLARVLKPAGEKFLGTEMSDDWCVIDLGDIIIHLMSANYRAKYDIEKFLAELKGVKNASN